MTEEIGTRSRISSRKAGSKRIAPVWAVFSYRRSEREARPPSGGLPAFHRRGMGSQQGSSGLTAPSRLLLMIGQHSSTPPAPFLDAEVRGRWHGSGTVSRRLGLPEHVNYTGVSVPAVPHLAGNSSRSVTIHFSNVDGIMPLLLIVVLVVLIAQIGFWDTLGAVLGAAAMIILLVVLVGAAVAIGGYMLFQRVRRRSGQNTSLRPIVGALSHSAEDHKPNSRKL